MEACRKAGGTCPPQGGLVATGTVVVGVCAATVPMGAKVPRHTVGHSVHTSNKGDTMSDNDNTKPKPYRGKAAFHLFELETVATTVIADMTRHAVALREQAVRAATEEERNELRYEAEGVYHETQGVIERTYGTTRKAEEVDALVYAAISSIGMPTTDLGDDVPLDLW